MHDLLDLISILVTLQKMSRENLSDATYMISPIMQQSMSSTKSCETATSFEASTPWSFPLDYNSSTNLVKTIAIIRNKCVHRG